MPNPAPAAQSAVTSAEDRVPVRTKISYGLGGSIDMWGHWLYPNLAYPVFNIFLGLSPQLVGTALMLIRIVDALSDPFFGWLSDNARTRLGRRRPFILVGSVFAGVGLPLLFFVPSGWSGNQLFWWMLGSSLLYIPFVSCFNMPYQSLGNELTPDYHERTSVMTFKMVIQKFFEVAFFVGLPFTNLAIFTVAATGKQNILLGVQVFCGILGALMLLNGLLVFFNVKERYYAGVAARQHDKVSLKASIYETMSCAPFRLKVIAGLCFSLGSSMVGSLGYYATVYYVAGGDTKSGNNWNGVMGAAWMIGGFIGPPVLAAICRRLGKQPSMLLALGIGFAAYGATWFLYTPSLPWLQVLSSGSMAFVAASYYMLDQTIGADIMDYDELNTGKRREGAFSACGSWMNKAGNALGYFLAGQVLALTGFAADKAAQSPETIFWIRALLAGIPIAGVCLAALFWWRYPLTQQKVAEIRQQLEIRRGKV
jgi:GPH family glycoside/pentoside/hexuronide:cation symporter